MSENIRELIHAASEASKAADNKDKIIMTELKDSGNYASFKLKDDSNTEKEYELCFSGNPSNEHPKAERAMRASSAVMDLFSTIEHQFNCFAVTMASIEPPEPDAFKSEIRLGEGYTVDKAEAVNDDDSTSAFTGATTHMIEVIIDIFLGNETTRTVVDRVYVEMDANNELKFESASGKAFEHMTQEQYKDLYTGQKEEEAKKKAEELLTKLRTGISNNYNKILTALAEDEKSVFSSFFIKLKNDRKQEGYNPGDTLDPHARNVGRIEMRYNTLFLGTERFKEFVYKIHKGSETFDFRLKWGRKQSSKDARLYYLESDGVNGREFIGLTTEKPEKGAKLFEAGDQIVCGQMPRTKKGVLRLENAVLPKKEYGEPVSCDRCGEKYFATPALNKKYREQFSVIDAKEDIKACGCERCAVNGKEFTMPNGTRVRYISSVNSFDMSVSGPIFAEIDFSGKYVEGGNVFECAHCDKDFYIGAKDQNRVSCDICGALVCKNCRGKMEKENVLMNCVSPGSGDVVFCKQCAGRFERSEAVRYKSLRCKMYNAYADGSESKPVKILAEENYQNSQLLEKCADCKKLIYKKSGTLKEENRCKRCGLYLGDECVKKAKKNDRGIFLICADCHGEFKRNPKLEKEFYSAVLEKKIREVNSVRTSKISSSYLKDCLNTGCRKIFSSYMTYKDRKAFGQNGKIEIDGAPLIIEKNALKNTEVTRTNYMAEYYKVLSANATYTVEFIAKVTVKASVYRFVISADVPFVSNDPRKLKNLKIIYGGVRSE